MPLPQNRCGGLPLPRGDDGSTALWIEGQQPFATGGADAALRDEGSDEVCGCYVEAVIHRRAAGGGAFHGDDLACLCAARHMRDFAGATLLDLDFAHAIAQ